MAGVELSHRQRREPMLNEIHLCKNGNESRTKEGNITKKKVNKSQSETTFIQKEIRVDNEKCEEAVVILSSRQLVVLYWFSSSIFHSFSILQTL